MEGLSGRGSAAGAASGLRTDGGGLSGERARYHVAVMTPTSSTRPTATKCTGRTRRESFQALDLQSLPKSLW